MDPTPVGNRPANPLCGSSNIQATCLSLEGTGCALGLTTHGTQSSGIYCVVPKTCSAHEDCNAQFKQYCSNETNYCATKKRLGGDCQSDDECDVNYDTSFTNNVLVCHENKCTAQGCTDPVAQNYKSTAGVNDGSCILPTSIDIDIGSKNTDMGYVYYYTAFGLIDNPTLKVCADVATTIDGSGIYSSRKMKITVNGVDTLNTFNCT